MKRDDIVLGGLLTGVGVLLLLQNFGLLGPLQDWLWAMLLAIAGTAFLGLFITNRSVWWPLIPGFVCFGLSAVISLEAIAPAAAT